MEEQASSYQKKAMLMNNKANHARLLAALKQRPDVLPSIMEHLDRLGVGHTASPSTPSPKREPWSPAGLVPTTPSAGGLSDAASDAGFSSGSGLDAADAAGDDKQPLDYIPRKYATVASLPVHYLKAALTHMEPISFGLHTLKGLLEPGKKTLPKKELLNLVEFVTDVKPDTHIPAAQRSMDAFLSWLGGENLNKGRRGKELMLRVDWASKGHYLLSHEVSKRKNIIKVKAQYADMEAVLPDNIAKGIVDPTKLFAAENWSVHDATLKEVGTAISINLILLFPGMCQQMVSAAVGRAVVKEKAEENETQNNVEGEETELKAEEDAAQLAEPDADDLPEDERAVVPPGPDDEGQ